jgi:CDP-4-dehydro-6-deoxyglucose reductase, E3
VLLTYAGRDYRLAPGESVLDGLTRHGVLLPSACRAGACQACLLRATSGDPGAAARAGLKPALAADGYFLACQARPVTGLEVAGGQDLITPAVLTGRRWLAEDVLAVWIRPRRPVSFRAGQHLTLHRAGGIARAYSIANLPAEAARDGLAFHVRVYPGGAMSGWLAQARPGTEIGVGVPAGECCYLPGTPMAPLLLAGTGTGIAPLVAIARDAAAQGHYGPVVIIHGAVCPERFYLGEFGPAGPAHSAGEPRGDTPVQPGITAGQPGITAGQPGIPGTARWRACALSRGEDIVTVAGEELARLADLGGVRAFLCGDPASVATMRRALFLAGMPLKHICADQFLPSPPPPPAAVAAGVPAASA